MTVHLFGRRARLTTSVLAVALALGASTATAQAAAPAQAKYPALSTIRTFAGKCLAKRDNLASADVPIVQYTCNGNWNQKFHY